MVADSTQHSISEQDDVLMTNLSQEIETLILRMLDDIGQERRSPEQCEAEGQVVKHQRSLRMSSSEIFQRINTWLANRPVKEEEMQLSP